MKRPREREAFDKNKRTHAGHGSFFNRPFQADEDKATPADRLASQDTHGLINLKFYPENSSELYPESKKLLEKNPNLRLGIDACMVCGQAAKKKKGDSGHNGASSDNSKECTRCFRIEYCDKVHKKRDKKAHSLVCDALCQINHDEEYLRSIGCEGDAGGMGDGTGAGGNQHLLAADNIDYAFDLIQYHKTAPTETSSATETAASPLRRERDLAGMLWPLLTQLSASAADVPVAQLRALPLPLGLMHRAWDTKSLVLMPVGGLVNNEANRALANLGATNAVADPNSQEAAVDAVDSSQSSRLPSPAALLRAPAVLRALTTYVSCPLTAAHVACSYAPLLGEAKGALNPHIEHTHASNDVDRAPAADAGAEDAATDVLRVREGRVFTVHVLGASTLEASVSHLPYWSLLPQALAARANLELQPLVPLAQTIHGHQAAELASATADDEDAKDAASDVSWRVRVVFIGPELPDNVYNRKALRELRVSPHLSLGFYKGTYDDFLEYAESLNPYHSAEQPNLPPAILAKLRPNMAQANEYNKTLTGFTYADALPHLVLGYQMGLTVREYNWGQSLTAIRNIVSTKRRRSWLHYLDSQKIYADAAARGVAADAADVQAQLEEVNKKSYLKDPRYEAFNVYVVTTSSSAEESSKEERILTAHYGCKNIFSKLKNPLVGMTLYQSGMLGNDVWMKSRYVSLYTAPNIF